MTQWFIKWMFRSKNLRDIYPHCTRFQLFKYRVMRFMRGTFIMTSIVTVLYATAEFGITFFPKQVLAFQDREVYVDSPAPVLDRIAKCESGGKQIGSNGQVVLKANTNGSVDIGKFQINSAWGKKATELGFDLTTEKGNVGFANWLYKNKGTSDWSSSAKCWNK